MWRFECPLFTNIECKHPERRSDHERRCYEKIDPNESEYYNKQVKEINNNAWDNCPLKKFTGENASREGFRVSIQIQKEKVDYYHKKKCNANKKLRSMQNIFKKKHVK